MEGFWYQKYGETCQSLQKLVENPFYDRHLYRAITVIDKSWVQRSLKWGLDISLTQDIAIKSINSYWQVG